MAVRLTFPRKYTRAQIEWRMDELALQFQRTHDPKIVRKLSNLTRLLARMEGRLPYRKDYH